MAQAICAICGSEKDRPAQVCPRCGCDPFQDDELRVRSQYLSVYRYSNPKSKAEYANDLDQLSERIRNGQGIDFDPKTMNRLRTQWLLVKDSSPTWFDIAKMLFVIFRPAIVALAILGALMTVVYSLRR